MSSRSKLNIVIIALLLLSASAFAQVTSNVVRRTFLIQNGTATATAFTLDVDGRQYLITAKHVVAGMAASSTINIRKGDEWVPLPVKVLRCQDPIDIAVLVPSEQISVSLELEGDTRGMYFGQEVLFVGFPYDVSLGLFTSGKGLNGDFPIGFVKRGLISAAHKENGVSMFFLDAHNNPGFSGAPVVFRDLSREQVTFKLLGVVSGFQTDIGKVFKVREIKPSEVKPTDEANGMVIRSGKRVFRLENSEDVVKGNSGIVVVYDIAHAIELIRANPIGPQVSDAFTVWTPKPKAHAAR